jgi:KUP system potassium uptake protein
MSKNPYGVPKTLLHNFKHNKVFHERIIILTLYTEAVPRVYGTDKMKVEELGHNFVRVIANYGFLERPDIFHVLEYLRDLGIECKINELTFVLGRETIIVRRGRGFEKIKKRLFAFLSRNMLPATHYFNVPPNRVIEIGLQVEI